ncbi:MAG: hypothetical protein ACE5J7_03485 [Candidatus Aenigmatarchaeota archaeon]
MEKAREKDCKVIIWLTGQKKKHDKIELSFIKKNNFTLYSNVKNWEAYPGKFVSDHSIWIKEL